MRNYALILLLSNGDVKCLHGWIISFNLTNVELKHGILCINVSYLLWCDFRRQMHCEHCQHPDTQWDQSPCVAPSPLRHHFTAPTPLSTERRCRRADGIRERDHGQRFHHSDCFDHYGLRWSATSYSTYPFSSFYVSVVHVLGFVYIL